MEADPRHPTPMRHAAIFGAVTGAAYALVAIVLALLEFGGARIDSAVRVPFAFVLLPVLGAGAAVVATWIRVRAMAWSRSRGWGGRTADEPAWDIDLTGTPPGLVPVSVGPDPHDLRHTDGDPAGR